MDKNYSYNQPNLLRFNCTNCGSPIIIDDPTYSHSIICEYCGNICFYNAMGKDINAGLTQKKIDSKILLKKQELDNKLQLDELHHRQQIENEQQEWKWIGICLLIIILLFLLCFLCFKYLI